MLDKQFYRTICQLSEFQRMWAEGYTPQELYDIIAVDYTYLDDNMNPKCNLTLEHIQEGFKYLDTKMKEHFLSVYTLEK